MFTSCSSVQLECNNFTIHETLEEIYKDEINEYLTDRKLSKINFQFRQLLENNINLSREDLVTSFFNNMDFNFEGIRTIQLNNEINKCDCESELNITPNRYFRDSYKQTLLKYSEHYESFDIKPVMIEFNENLGSFSIAYEGQVTDNNEDIYVNTSIGNELLEQFENYMGKYYLYRAIENKTEEIIDKSSSNSKEKNTTYLKTNVDNLRVRTSPNLDSKTVENLKIGTNVKFVEKSTNKTTVTIKGNQITEYWYKVQTPNGQTGWIHGCCFSN